MKQVRAVQKAGDKGFRTGTRYITLQSALLHYYIRYNIRSSLPEKREQMMSSALSLYLLQQSREQSGCSSSARTAFGKPN